jgi:hypothetical protein
LCFNFWKVLNSKGESFESAPRRGSIFPCRTGNAAVSPDGRGDTKHTKYVEVEIALAVKRKCGVFCGKTYGYKEYGEFLPVLLAGKGILP